MSKCDICEHEYKCIYPDCPKCNNTGIITEVQHGEVNEFGEGNSAYSGKQCDCPFGMRISVRQMQEGGKQ